MWILLVIVWVLSPFVLIPMTISAKRKNTRFKSFLDDLYCNKRISFRELNELKVISESPKALDKTVINTAAPVFKDQEKAEKKTEKTDRIIPAVYNYPKQEPIKPVPKPVVNSSSVQDNKKPVAASYSYPEQHVSKPAMPVKPVINNETTAYTAPIRTAPVKQIAQNKRPGAMNVLMMIGVIFVILAGLVFSTAVWVNMGNVGRTCAIGIIAALFFGVSAFSHKKLKLESTAFAFYTLGSFFTAIVLLTAGFFGLMGEFLSVEGDGCFILYSLAALIISLLLAKGHSIFKKDAAVYISVFAAALSLMLIVIQISSNIGIFALIMAIVTAAFDVFVYIPNVKLPEKWDNAVNKAAGVLNAVAAAFSAVTEFTGGFAAYACAGVYIFRCAAAFVLGYKGHKIYDRTNTAAVSVYSSLFFITMLICNLSSFNESSDAVFALAMTAAAFILSNVLAFSAEKIPDSWFCHTRNGSVIFSAVALAAALNVQFDAVGEWTAINYIIAALYIVQAFANGIMAAYGNSTHKKSPSAFVSVFTGMVVAVLLINELSSVTEIKALCFTVFFLAIVNVLYSANAKLPENWKLPLDITTALMGIISVSMSLYVLICNFFFENSIVICCIISALYILQSIAITVMAYKGHSVYGNALFGVLSQFTGIIFFVIMLLMAGDNLELAASAVVLAITVAMLCYVNFVFTFRINKPQEWHSPLAIAAAAFAAFSVIMFAPLVDDYDVNNVICYIISALYILQSIAITVMAYKGHSVYGKSIFGVISQFTGIIFLVIMLLMAVDKMELAGSAFVLAVTIAMLCYVNFVFTLRINKPQDWHKPLGIAAAAFAGFSLIMFAPLINEWDNICYIISALYILQSIAMTVMAYKGHSEYIKLRWGIISQLAGIGFTVLTAYQLAPDDDCFALMLSVLAVLFTVYADIAFAKVPEKWIYVNKAACMILNSIGAIASGIMLIVNFGDWNVYCYIAAVLYIVYTAVWGVCFNSTIHKSVECIISAASALNIFLYMDDMEISSACLVLTLIYFALAMLHHFAKPVRTKASDIILPICTILSGINAVYDHSVFGFVSCVLMIILLAVKSSEKDSKLAAVFGILLPVPVFAMIYNAGEICADMFADGFKHSMMGYVYCVSAAVQTIISAVMLRRKSRHKYWSFTAAAIISLICALGFDFVGVGAACLIISLLLTAVICKSENNIPSAVTVICAYGAVEKLAYLFEPSNGYAVHLTAAIIFALISIAASRLFFADKLIRRDDGRIAVDTFSLGIFLSSFMLGSMAGNAELFTALTFISVFTANLCRKGNAGDFNRAMLTLSCGLFTFALLNRPFLTFNFDIEEKITLALIALFGFAFSRIWKKYPKIAENVSSVIYGICFILLIVDALTYQSIANTIIVLGVSLAILLYSFARKKKRWFAVSTVSLTGLTLYIFRDFFHMIDWWVYLLAVGILLIAISSANEYFIRKGREIKEKTGRFFEDWTW